ncbi:MAG: helix-turn-helix domain-containing protein [Treponema sp.]|jgi:transcriptional regulator with XRE-family HTH domain|nr:helix-turn-helix domain-containing protein [Treponema sp.]
MKNRIQALRKALRLNQYEFAKRLGMKSSALSMIEVGNNTLTDKNIKLICMTFNVNEQWLRTGFGDMFNASPYESEFFAIFQDLMPETQQALVSLARDLLETQKKLLGTTDTEKKELGQNLA